MFCPKCGTQLSDGSNSCSGCGFVTDTAKMNRNLNQAVQNPSQPNYNYGQPPQPYQPPPPSVQPNQQYFPHVQPYYAPAYVKLSKPGKGFGIASMILGIFGIVYSSMLSLIALQAILYDFARDSGDIDLYKNMKMVTANLFESDNIENIIAVIFTCLVCAVLAFIFAAASKNKGYRNKISKSGFILSIVSAALVVAFVLFAGYAYNSSPSKEAIQTDPLIGTWVATDKVSTVTFEENGEGELGGYGFPSPFTYTTNDNKLTLNMDNGYEVVKFTYKIQGNKLTWTNEEDGNVMVFTRKK